MKLQNVGKMAFVVVALCASGVLAYQALFKANPQDSTNVGQLCVHPGCGYEFEIPLAELKRLGREHRAPTCPKCGRDEVITGHKCGSCGRMNQPYGHGGTPPKCAYCKKNWVDAVDPK